VTDPQLEACLYFWMSIVEASRWRTLDSLFPCDVANRGIHKFVKSQARVAKKFCEDLAAEKSYPQEGPYPLTCAPPRRTTSRALLLRNDNPTRNESRTVPSFVPTTKPYLVLPRIDHPC
jgi:hypothetical protein